MAYKIELSEKELEDLTNRMNSEKDPKIYKRLQSIRLKTMKYKNIKIAEILAVTKETITNWFKLYLNNGFDGLCNLDYDGRRPIKLDEYKDIIINISNQNGFSTVIELKQILEERYNIRVCKSWLSKYLKKNRLLIQKNSFNTRRRKKT